MLIFISSLLLCNILITESYKIIINNHKSLSHYKIYSNFNHNDNFIKSIKKNYKKSIIPTLVSILSFSMPNIAYSAELQPAPWDPLIQYEVIKAAPNGAIPKKGENVAIRFRGSYNGVEFDNIMKAEQPYFYKAGLGILMKGIDESVVNMHVGDKYHLVFGGDLAFGAKGKPSSPGKPRIPPMATVDYELEVVSIPGAEEEFIADIEE